MVTSEHLNSLVHKIVHQLSRAEVACSIIKSCHGHGHSCQPLAQLQQAIKDGKDGVEREYDHLHSQHPKHGSKGDHRARHELLDASRTIEDQIAEPLESLMRHVQNHGTHHHTHDHCHCQCHHHPHEYHILHGLVRYRVNTSSHAHHRHDHDSDWKFETMLRTWEAVKSDISDCFDDLETRLDRDNNHRDDCNSGDSSDNSRSRSRSRKRKKNGTKKAVKSFIKTTGEVEKEMKLLNDAHEALHDLDAAHRSRSTSCSSSC